MDSRIQSYLRLATSGQRETEQIGSFLATFNRWNDNPFLNYAIPDNDATPTLNEVNALIHAYQKRGRKPRLEYITKLAPAVEEILISAGFVVEGRLPLMTCTPPLEQFLTVPEGIELLMPVSDAQILATVTVQNEAYGESQPSPEDAQSLRTSIAADGIAVLARVTATGEAVGAGVCSVPFNQTTEVAGIGVVPSFRRRGIAGALTTRLVQEAFNKGVTVAFLMAAHEAEERIYTRVGFSRIGEILHISLPYK
ncbi:MAG: GNAT family N-acetyltransferase [Nostoc sp. NMS1]|uniref:GNAT family N-acetyltransferase n=1 Tax=Nostoc sp. NMS1 TaxID=2815388 RepID=UPI0025FBE1FF|nr:GNAT family N-acetyltransferase [Nostoc sp. NMS1]MBN3907269.1 GNAT family N-acetyltransferase [Nostoc sp. NMS1]